MPSARATGSATSTHTPLGWGEHRVQPPPWGHPSVDVCPCRVVPPGPACLPQEHRKGAGPCATQGLASGPATLQFLPVPGPGRCYKM